MVNYIYGVIILDKKLIYIADDETNIRNIIKSFLVKEGFDVETFDDGSKLFDAFNKKQADMLVIDIMMPNMDGYSLCSLVRQKSSVPIIIVSAKDTEPDKIAGLTLGSDDYLTKPFSPMELIARIKSIFRRIELDNSNTSSTSTLSEGLPVGDIVINSNLKQVQFNGSDIGLTKMEFEVVYYLTVNKNRAVSRSELLDKIWGFENEVETRATDDAIKRIRKKLSDAGSNLKIETVWGYGFKIQDRE